MSFPDHNDDQVRHAKTIATLEQIRNEMLNVSLTHCYPRCVAATALMASIAQHIVRMWACCYVIVYFPCS